MLRRICAFAAVVVLVGALSAEAAKKSKEWGWDPVTEAEWQIVSDSAKGIHRAVCLFERVHADESRFPEQKVARTIYSRYRILNEKGRELGDVDIIHTNRKMKVTSVSGRTILRDGTAIELDPQKVVTKEVVRMRGEKVRQTSFSMPGMTDDCIIEYMYSVSVPTFIPVWTIQKEIPVLHAELTWITPVWDISTEVADAFEDFITPNYLWLNANSRYSIEQLPNIKEPESLFFAIDSVQAFESEPNTVPEQALKTKLVCYPGSTKAPMGYWSEMAARIPKWLNTFCEKNKRVKETVGQWAGLPDEKAKAEAAFNWLRANIVNVQYVTLKDDKGADLNLKDRNVADDVFKLGYGDRGDINYVFCDMLREMNIDATIIYCGDRTEDLFVPDAKYWQFDHHLVHARFKDNSVKFYGPGYMHLPIDQVPWYVEGTDCLSGSGNQAIDIIPFGDPELNSTERYFRYTVDEDLAVSGELEIRLRGHAARTIRLALEDEDSTDFKNLIVERVKEDFRTAELTLASFENLNDCTQPLKLKFTIEQPDLTPAGDKILLKPFDYGARTEDPFYAPTQVRDILFNYGEKTRESVVFELPPTVTVEASPADTSFKNRLGQSAVSIQTVGTTLNVQRAFSLLKAYVPVGSYAHVRELFLARQQQAGQVVVLKVSEEE